MDVIRRATSFFSRNRCVFSLGLGAVTISSLTGLLAGLVLGSMSETLELLPGLMVLIPAAIGMRGAIFGAVGSRLGTALHMGTFELSFRKGTILRNNFEISLILTMIMSVSMGILAKLFSELLGFDSIGVLDFVFISVVGGVLAGLILILTNILVAYVGFKRNWDIDNISSPIITTAGDVITLPLLYIAALLTIDLNAVGWNTMVDLVTILFFAVTALIVIRYARIQGGGIKRTIVESVPVLLLCMTLFILAGTVIEGRLEYLITYPALLILIPPFLDTGGNLGGILSSRLSSKLHMGLMEPRRVPDRLAVENFGIMYLLSVWIYPLLGLLIHLISTLLGLESPGAVSMVLIATISGVLIITFLNLLAYITAVYSFRFSLDPDNTGIPVTTAGVDLGGAMILMSIILLISG